MPYATLAALNTRIEAPHERLFFEKAASGTIGTPAVGSQWTMAGNPGTGATPTTSVACDRTTTGALGQQNAGATALRLIRSQLAAQSGTVLCNYWLCDRLNMSGGLDGTVATAQTTNLPTAALTRYTSGVGVMIAIEFYTAVGTTATTITASYTNQAGTSGRTTPATSFGSTQFREAARILVLPLQAGDTGVRSVESVTLGASTLTAGNFGVTLFKPLMPLPNVSTDVLAEGNPILTLGGMMPEIMDDACLWLVGFGSNTTTLAVHGQLRFAADDT